MESLLWLSEVLGSLGFPLLHCLVFKVRDPLPSGDSFTSLASFRLRVNRPVDSTGSSRPGRFRRETRRQPAARSHSIRRTGRRQPARCCLRPFLPPGRRLRKRQKPLPKSTWLRGRDLNPRPPGYEPDELPGCSTPRYETGARAGIRTRDLSVISRVLWPTELPSHVELMTGLEPVTSSLPRTCSTS